MKLIAIIAFVVAASVAEISAQDFELPVVPDIPAIPGVPGSTGDTTPEQSLQQWYDAEFICNILTGVRTTLDILKCLIPKPLADTIAIALLEPFNAINKTELAIVKIIDLLKKSPLASVGNILETVKKIIQTIARAIEKILVNLANAICELVKKLNLPTPPLDIVNIPGATNLVNNVKNLLTKINATLQKVLDALTNLLQLVTIGNTAGIPDIASTIEGLKSTLDGLLNDIQGTVFGLIGGLNLLG